ncbi:MAG: BspA family leucine-rich repeat surface protein [Cytophagales bacterium]|nr:BspA family leucine-rich repeat surface protein [Cytophagales bacterium]MDW8383441.1 BspA family leucine-rich repeat surface protein [Flammeovirgaceae bacterium]
MKFILLIGFTILFQKANAQPGNFITKWYFDSSASTLRFYALTTGPVNYTWFTSSGNSGNGTFSQTTIGMVTLAGITTTSHDTLTLSISPTHLKRFANMHFHSSIVLQNPDASKLIDVTQWGNVLWSSMANAFAGCINLKISATDAPNLTNVSSMSYMFAGATSLNQPINHWNVSNVADMSGTFAYATSFNQPLNNWNTSNVTEMNRMFAHAISFNQPLNNWNVSNVIDMSNMFDSAVSFNQSLGNWKLHSNVNLTHLLNKSGMDCFHYSATLSGWANSPSTPSNRTLGASGLKYSPSATAWRNALIAKNWTIYGDEMASDVCYPITIWNGFAWSNGVPNHNLKAIIDGNFYTQFHGNITAARIVINADDTLLIHTSGSVAATDSIENNGTILSCEGSINGIIKGNHPIVASLPLITVHPTHQIVAPNSTATFSVVALGNFLKYEWKQAGNTVGENSAYYTTPPTTLADNGKKYSVIVSNFCGNTVSDTAILNVEIPAKILKEDHHFTSALSYFVNKTIYTECNSPCEIFVYNSSGHFIGKGATVSVNNPGIYIIKILTEKYQVQNKILIE